MYKPKYFKVYEFVSSAVFKKYGESALKFIDPKIVQFVDNLRQNTGCRIVINNSTFQQRGLRENTCSIVKDKTSKGIMYLSGHTLGRAVDFSSPDITADGLHKHITENYTKLGYCNFINRIESKLVTCPKGYVHVDNMGTTESLHEFMP